MRRPKEIAQNMTNFEIRRFQFDLDEISLQSRLEPKIKNWPVVYTISDSARIYVGESTSAVKRLDGNKKLLKDLYEHLDTLFEKVKAFDLDENGNYGYRFKFHGKIWHYFNKPYERWGTYYTIDTSKWEK